METIIDPTTLKLAHYINARFPVIAVRTFESSRIIEEIARVAAGSNSHGKTLLTWSRSKGLRKIDYSGERVVDTDISNPSELGLKEIGTYAPPPGALRAALALKDTTPTIVVVYNYHHWIKDPEVQQLILDVADLYTMMPHTLILLGSTLEVPTELSKAITVIDWPLPDTGILGKAVEAVAYAVDRRWQLPVDISNKGAIVRALQGMTLEEANGSMSFLVASQERFDASPECINLLNESKAHAIKQAAALEYWPADKTLDNIGGLDLLKLYLEDAALAFTEEAEEFGVLAPRGMLLVGLPGTGKTLAAKVAAHVFGVPLVRMDMGAIFGGLVGASERNMRVGLDTIEAVAPCVLLLDEVDKGGGGGGGERSDGGTGARVLATLLTWMQERSRKAKVFVSMTANSIATINPALFRRADQFYIPLPGLAARADILRIHLNAAGRDPDALGIDLEAVAGAAENFSGGELEEGVLSSIRKAFKAWHGERDVTQELLVRALKEIRPVAETMAAELQDMLEWGVNARQASSADSKPGRALRSGARIPDNM